MLLVATWICPSSGYADSAPQPRPPLLQQFNMPVGNVARVSNLGNQALTISYLNGANGWQTLPVGSSQFVDITCDTCGGQINLAFNNGKVLIQTVVLVGFNYELFWSDQTSTWEIHPSAPFQ